MLIDPQQLFAHLQARPGSARPAPPPPAAQGFDPDRFQAPNRLGAVSRLLGLQPAVSVPAQVSGSLLAQPDRLFGFDPDQLVETAHKDERGRPIMLARDSAAGLDKMYQIAQARGISLKVTSAYRSVDHQHELWENALQKYGSEAEARHWVAPPGKSRHNFGKAIDMHMFRGDNRVSQAEFDEIIALAGMYRPMEWESWHVEPLSTKATRARR
ncbi:MAG: D-alanyl-D-alanine carboxypeptidase family protein [Candidatus Sericytochromatia bacterium]